MSASNRNFPPAGNAEGIYTFSHPGFSYVAVLPNRAYGAFTTRAHRCGATSTPSP